MTEFILVYRGGTDSLEPDEQRARMGRWKQWLEDLGDDVVDPGRPLGAFKAVRASSVRDMSRGEAMSGFSIIKAPDIDAAVAIAKACPFLEFSDGLLEVAEVKSMIP